MRCRNCGEEMPDRGLVCGKCGTPVRPEDIPGEEPREAAAEGAAAEESAEVHEAEPRWYREPEQSQRIPYSAGPVRMERRGADASRQMPEVELTGREGYAKIGQFLAFCSIAAMFFPLAVIPLSVAAIVLGFIGYHSALSKQAVRAIVIGTIMLLTGMVLIVAAAMMLPYLDELVSMFAAGVPG